MRRALRYWLQVDRDAKARRDRDVYVDVDAIAECVDVLRSCGRAETNDPALCEGVVWLLDHQLPSGAWKAEIWSEGAPEPNDFYSQVHPTWTATHALRDRDFARAHEASRAWEVVIRALTREVGFDDICRTLPMDPPTEEELAAAAAADAEARGAAGGELAAAAEQGADLSLIHI